MAYKLEDHDGDLVMIGPDLNPFRFKEIKADLPPEDRAKLIGWKKVTRLA